MKTRAILFPGTALLAVMALAQVPGPAVWKKRVITREFLTEGIGAGDLDGDGKKDLVAGPFWFKGPDFTQAVQFRPGQAQPVKTYQEDSFLTWVDDLNGDGKKDVLMASHPGRDLTLYLNPGKTGDNWPAHRVMTEAATESPLWL
ncbi:MAG: VCBS repeat-containing protein, partial [Verrucomicrobiaceae bacterium]